MYNGYQDIVYGIKEYNQHKGANYYLVCDISYIEYCNKINKEMSIPYTRIRNTIIYQINQLQTYLYEIGSNKKISKKSLQ